MARMHLPEPHRDLAKVARQAGWTLEWTRRSNRVAWSNPAGIVKLYTACTPNCSPRERVTLRAKLRQAGLDV